MFVQRNISSIVQVVAISRQIWYAPDYHLFFSGPCAVEEATQQLADYLASNSVQPAEMRLKETMARESVLPPEEVLRKSLATLTVEATSACNLACSYCYLFGSGRMAGETPCSGQRRPSVPDLCKELASVIEQTEQPELTVQFIGGEPLLNLGALKTVLQGIAMSATSAGKRIHFQVLTNGTLLTRKAWALLDEHRVEVLLSLDGPHGLHDMLRPFRNGQGSLRAILQNFRGREAHTSVLLMLCKPTKALTSNLRWLLEERGFGAVSFNYIYTQDSNLELSKQDADEILADVDSNASFYLRHFNRIRNFKRFAQYFDHDAARFSACNAGRNYAALGADGEYYLCQRGFGVKSLLLRELRSNLPQNVFHSVSQDEHCSKCWARWICGGLCWFNPLYWPNAYRETRCHFTRELIRRAARLHFSSERRSADSNN